VRGHPAEREHLLPRGRALNCQDTAATTAQLLAKQEGVLRGAGGLQRERGGARFRCWLRGRHIRRRRSLELILVHGEPDAADLHPARQVLLGTALETLVEGALGHDAGTRGGGCRSRPCKCRQLRPHTLVPLAPVSQLRGVQLARLSLLVHDHRDLGHVAQEQECLDHCGLEVLQQAHHVPPRARLLLDAALRGGSFGAQGEAEEGPPELRGEVTAEELQLQWRELVGERLHQHGSQRDAQSRFAVADAREVLGVRVEHDDRPGGHQGGHVGEMVDGAEAQTEPSSTSEFIKFAPLAYAAQVLEIRLGEAGVIVRVQRRPLPSLHVAAQERRGSIRVRIEQQRHLPRARIICILEQLEQHADSFGVQGENVAQTLDQGLLLTERLGGQGAGQGRVGTGGCDA